MSARMTDLYHDDTKFVLYCQYIHYTAAYVSLTEYSSEREYASL